MRNLVLLSIFLLCSIFSFAQSGKMEFTQKKIVGDEITVYFYVQNIESDEQAQILLDDLLADDGILSGRYFKAGNGKDRFQLYISENISAEYVRNILMTHNVDFDFSTVSVNDIILNPEEQPEHVAIMGSQPKVLPEGFPVYEKTGNPELDAEKYRNEKDKWIEENPDKYNQMVIELKENNSWREE